MKLHCCPFKQAIKSMREHTSVVCQIIRGLLNLKDIFTEVSISFRFFFVTLGLVSFKTVRNPNLFSIQILKSVLQIIHNRKC